MTASCYTSTTSLPLDRSATPLIIVYTVYRSPFLLNTIPDRPKSVLLHSTCADGRTFVTCLTPRYEGSWRVSMLHVYISLSTLLRHVVFPTRLATSDQREPSATSVTRLTNRCASCGRVVSARCTYVVLRFPSIRYEVRQTRYVRPTPTSAQYRCDLPIGR